MTSGANQLSKAGEPSTAERLLHAAQEIIVRDGYASASTRKIAERAAVLPGVVHYHVGTIDQLRRRAVLAGVADYFQHALPVEKGGEEGGCDAITVAFAALEQEPPESLRTRLLFESLHASVHDAELRGALAALLESFRGMLSDRLRTEGYKDPEGRALAVAAALDGFILQRALDPSVSAAPIISILRTGGPSRS